MTVWVVSFDYHGDEETVAVCSSLENAKSCASHLAGGDGFGRWASVLDYRFRAVTPDGRHACYIEPFRLDEEVPVAP